MKKSVEKQTIKTGKIPANVGFVRGGGGYVRQLSEEEKAHQKKVAPYVHMT